MSLAACLSRLTPALSGKQRALLVVRAHLDGREPDRDWLEMPQDQRREYDYFIALAFTSNNTLGTLLQSLVWIVDAIESDQEQYALLSTGATLVEEALEETPDPDLVRRWQGRSNVTLPTFLRGLERDIRSQGLQRLLVLWQELRSLELLWAEIAAECDGDDLRASDLGVSALVLRTRLLVLLQTTSPKHASKPPETREGALASVRQHVNEAMRFMGFREPEE